MKHNIQDWAGVLTEFDIPPLGGQPDAAGGQAPGSAMGAGAGGYEDSNIANMPQQGMEPENPDPSQGDITQDPSSPDMPEEKNDVDFETWRNNYFKEVIKGDANHLIDIIHQVRDRDLDANQAKFVEDNIQIQFLRQDSNIEKMSKEIVKSVREELNDDQPAVSMVNHLVLVLETLPVVTHMFIKCSGLWGAKGDFHRKLIGALFNAVQVGAGGMETGDLVYNENEKSVEMSTRFNNAFGSMLFGAWSLREDDPERFLEPPEMKKLQDGSPEERDVLHRRIVLESIISLFKKRAFIMHVVNPEGTIYTIGIDPAEMLMSAFKDGKLVVRTSGSENNEAMIDDDGKVLPYVDLSIKYVKPTGYQNDEGKPEVEELDFLEKQRGQLWFTAELQTIQDASSTLNGFILKENPWKGNPNDLKALRRCVPSVAEILTRRC